MYTLLDDNNNNQKGLAVECVRLRPLQGAHGYKQVNEISPFLRGPPKKYV